MDETLGPYRIEVNEGPGSGVKVLNRPTPQRSESVRYGENLYARAKELVGDRDPREHEFSVQLRLLTLLRIGSQLGLAVLLPRVAHCLKEVSGWSNCR